MASRLASTTRWLRWLTPGLQIKRWLLLLMVSELVLVLGVAYALKEIYQTAHLPSSFYWITLQCLPYWARAFVFGVFGVGLLLLSYLKLTQSVLGPFLPGTNTSSLVEVIHAFRLRGRGPRIVAIGGGTGLSSLLRGLKTYTSNLSAIVTVADDGGSSGRLRDEYRILPPGDFRQCLIALADAAPLTELRLPAAFIATLLGEWKVPFERPLETGVIGKIVGAKPGPTIAIRCDIDALPITEENQTDYTSTAPGRMHACGHDDHTAIQLGLAKILSGLTDQISGEIRLLFQPAEELVESGARHFIDAGALKGVDRIVGLHLWSGLDVGKMSIRSGPVMARLDAFEIRVTGSGGHGAFPHQTIDALVIAAGMVAELQTVVSRRIDPLEPEVLTVGTFNAGTAFNVISGEAVMTGTTRALSDQVREQLEESLRAITTRHAEGNGAKATVAYHRGRPPHRDRHR